MDLLLVDYYRFDIEYLTILCLGGIGTFLTTPMDVVKTRIIAGPGSSYQYSNVMEAVVNILQGEGPGAFLSELLLDYCIRFLLMVFSSFAMKRLGSCLE